MKAEETKSTLYYILIWGSLWGIFEATVGYLLHLLPFSVGWLIWYPVACFFMANVYRATNKISSIVLVGFLCTSIKLLNLMLPGRIDKVINPAISILFESLAMAAAILLFQKISNQKPKSFAQKATMVLVMNTGWRLLFILYLLFLVPDWMREVSVISESEKFIPFFITHNLMTSVLIAIGYFGKSRLLKPILYAEDKIKVASNKIPLARKPVIQVGTACVLLCVSILLEFIL